MSATAKKVTTVRLEPEDYQKIAELARKTHQSESAVIRETIRLGLVNLIGGEEEDLLIKKRLSQHVKDVDGKSFIKELKQEFGL